MRLKLAIIFYLSIVPTIAISDGLGTGSVLDILDEPAQEESLPEGHPMGRLTLMEHAYASRDPVSVVDVLLPDDEKLRVVSGKQPWRHPNGTLIYAVGCGKLINRIYASEPNGTTRELTPCSSALKRQGNLSMQFGSAQLSPDENLLAVEVFHYQRGSYYYNIAIYRDNEVIQLVPGNSPTWVDNDTFLLSSNGLFVVDVGSEPRSLNDNIKSGVGDADVSSDGQRIVLEWNQQLWTMDVDGGNLLQLYSGGQRYKHPVWSPDGGFVGFLAEDSSRKSDKVFYLDLSRNKLWASDIKPQLGINYLSGPLSWTQ